MGEVLARYAAASGAAAGVAARNSAELRRGRSRSASVNARPKAPATTVIQNKSPIARANTLLAPAITLGIRAGCPERICASKGRPLPTFCRAPDTLTNWEISGWGMPSAVRFAGSRLVNDDEKTVPAAANPTEAPIWRIKVSVLVATPSLVEDTRFWTTTV